MANNKDQKVIDFMFDPFLVEQNFSDPADNDDDNLSDHPQKLTTEQQESKRLEMKAIESANNGQYDQAFDYFQQALQLWPENASVLNNRAQTYRLQNRIADARQDLDEAIQLLGDLNLSVDSHLRQVARQAYCQRALIHLLEENRELGLKDMQQSAQLGNQFARAYMAKMNPYAALCNQMLQDMFQQCTTSSRPS
ncbi:tetratricopeptide repeat protein 36 homolog [Dermatophagoides pteronyssinus]|uniref:tetratricopeptide repeat protein 36 homolog n=1 Tax=Dermatophagoides pteronyssinus TaxID=6956 RepID=UPI003F676924